MANIEFNAEMRKKYGLDLDDSNKEYFWKSIDSRALSNLGTNYEEYFLRGTEINICLLFIDVCNFSTKFGNFSGKEVSDYFQGYYDIIMPIIFKYEGVIDKVIGDGIIAIFGKPFINKSPLECFPHADLCAKEILISTNNTRFSSKVAFHSGKIRYFKNTSGYEEYTVIGKPITELFRLESISMDQSINYYNRSVVKIYYDDLTNSIEPFKEDHFHRWVEYYMPIQPPKGTDYHSLSYLQYV